MLKRIESIECDGDNCNKVRDKDSNHWLVGIDYAGFVVLAVNRDVLVKEKIVHGEVVMDFCGEECAVKWISKMLPEIKDQVKKKIC
jgi:hypothetical protein